MSYHSLVVKVPHRTAEADQPHSPQEGEANCFAIVTGCVSAVLGGGTYEFSTPHPCCQVFSVAIALALGEHFGSIHNKNVVVATPHRESLARPESVLDDHSG